MFEVFEHTADVGLRIRADDLPSLFADAGRGLFSLIVRDLDTVRLEKQVPIEISGDKHDYLLFDWLNELLYLFESRRLLFAKFDVKTTDGGITATAHGEPVDTSRHQLEHEVKAITYHRLSVTQEASGWLAEMILDI